MRVLLIGLVVAMLSLGRAAAGDWSGLYIGADAALAAGDAGFTTSLTDDEPDFDLLGGALGIHAGHRWQSGNLVLGLEAAAAWQPFGDEQISPLDPVITYRLNLDWLLRTTASLGYANGAWLTYARLGHAAAAVQTAGRHATLPDSFSATRIQHGITAGAGIERRFSQHLSAGLVYDYTHLFSTDHGGRTALGFDYVNAGVDVDLHTISTRLSYRFGGPAGN
jgi:outer membrane immunogenic protein